MIMFQNLSQTKATAIKQSRELTHSFVNGRQLSTNSVHYSTIRIGVDNTSQSQTLTQSYIAISNEWRQNLNTGLSNKTSSSNYLEMIEKMKMQKNEEKNGLVIVKLNKGIEGESKQTIIEKCLTLPSFPSSFETIIPQRYKEIYQSFQKRETKCSKFRKLIDIYLNILEQTQQYFGTDQNEVKGANIDPPHTGLLRQSISFTPAINDKDALQNRKFKEIRMSPHKHSYTQFNLQQFESPKSINKVDFNGYLQEANKIQTPSFNRMKNVNEKNYPKLYDELYAASFQYPEQEDPVLEIDQSHQEQEAPFFTSFPLRDNFVSFSSGIGFQNKNEEVLVNCNVYQNKANMLINSSTNQEQRSKMKAQKATEDFANKYQIKNGTNNISKISIMPMTMQITQTPCQSLIQNIQQENNISMNKFSSPRQLNTVQNAINKSGLDSNNLTRLRIEQGSPQKQYSKTDQQTINENDCIRQYSPNIQKVSILENQGSSSSSTALLSSSSSSSSSLQQNISRNIDINQYLKDIPEYKPLTVSTLSQQIQCKAQSLSTLTTEKPSLSINQYLSTSTIIPPYQSYKQKHPITLNSQTDINKQALQC